MAKSAKKKTTKTVKTKVVTLTVGGKRLEKSAFNSMSVGQREKLAYGKAWSRLDHGHKAEIIRLMASSGWVTPTAMRVALGDTKYNPLTAICRPNAKGAWPCGHWRLERKAVKCPISGQTEKAVRIVPLDDAARAYIARLTKPRANQYKEALYHYSVSKDGSVKYHRDV